MTNICVLDIETSISGGPHSGTFRDINNDFYTLIVGTTLDNVIAKHSHTGFKRQLNLETSYFLYKSDIIIGHNLPFDLSYIWKNECFRDFLNRGGQVWDTQIAEYLLSGQRHSYASLAELQYIYLGEKVKEDKISKLFSKKIGADKIIQAKDRCPRLFKLYDKYCHDDGETTLKVFYKQYKRAKELGMIPIIKLYNNYMLALVETMTNGIVIDTHITEKILQTFKLKSLKYLKQSSDIVKGYWTDTRLPEFNVKSPTHKSALLFGGDIKVKVKVDNGFYKNGKPKTKTEEQFVHVEGFKLPLELTSPSGVEGKYNTGKEIIDKIYEYTQDPTIKEYCTVQRKSMNIEKMCSTYLEPFLNLNVNGKIHPYYNNTATTTGRLSSKLPNFQNIVSKGGMEKYIKRPLVAPEGYICVSIDFSQLEIYILALFSGDESLKADLLTGIDFHVLRLSYAEDMSYDEVYKLCKIDKLPEWDLKRSKAKIISYQKAYGASPAKLAQTTGLDIEIIKKIFEKEDINYPRVKEFNEYVASQLEATKTHSLSKHIPKYKKGAIKGSKRFIGGIELLPIQRDKLNCDFDPEYLRHVGTFTSMTGKRYTFEEMANYDKFGKVRRGFAPTQIKNYPQQGGAADVVAMATSEVFKYSLTTNKEVVMCNQIHDSLEFYIKEDKKDLYISKLKCTMENIPLLFKKYLNIEIDLMFKCDVKVGNNFAEMQEYKIEEK